CRSYRSIRFTLLLVASGCRSTFSASIASAGLYGGPLGKEFRDSHSTKSWDQFGSRAGDSGVCSKWRRRFGKTGKTFTFTVLLTEHIYFRDGRASSLHVFFVLIGPTN